MLNLYYVPADYPLDIPNAVELTTLTELFAYTDSLPAQDTNLIVSTVINHPAVDILEHFLNYRKHITTLARSAFTFNRIVRMRPGPVASQPFFSMIRILANAIWVLQDNHWVELKTSELDTRPGVWCGTA